MWGYGCFFCSELGRCFEPALSRWSRSRRPVVYGASICSIYEHNSMGFFGVKKRYPYSSSQRSYGDKAIIDFVFFISSLQVLDHEAAISAEIPEWRKTITQSESIRHVVNPFLSQSASMRTKLHVVVRKTAWFDAPPGSFSRYPPCFLCIFAVNCAIHYHLKRSVEPNHPWSSFWLFLR